MARRGLAPIAATLILVAITVTAVLITYLWLSSYTGMVSQASEPIQLSEVLKIEGVEYSDGKLRITVRNVGSRKTTIAALYILAQDRTAVLARTDLEVELEPGVAVNLEVDAQLKSSTYLVKLVTRTGVEAVTTLTGVMQPGAPSFQIVYYEEEISGPVESTATFNVRLRNVGEASGTALLKILDEEDKTLSQVDLSLQPSKERSVSLTLKLPSARGSTFGA